MSTVKVVRWFWAVSLKKLLSAYAHLDHVGQESKKWADWKHSSISRCEWIQNSDDSVFNFIVGIVVTLDLEGKRDFIATSGLKMSLWAGYWKSLVRENLIQTFSNHNLKLSCQGLTQLVDVFFGRDSLEQLRWRSYKSFEMRVLDQRTRSKCQWRQIGWKWKRHIFHRCNLPLLFRAYGKILTLSLRKSLDD